MSDALLSLDGRVCVVTGALGLLGREHVKALAGAGASVVATDVDARACEVLARETEGVTGRPALGVAADVTSKDDVVRLEDRVLERFGRVDVLVANAAIDDKVERPLQGGGALEASRFESFSVERFRRSLDVNVTGTFLCCQVLGAEMARSGRGGSIVVVASTYGLVAPDQGLYRAPDGTQRFYKGPAYPTSKGAVLQLMRYAASYWGRAGVRVNALSPGGVENGQDADFVAAYSAKTMLGRMARPMDYQGALVFLASDASAYVTGANLVVDGGFTSW